MKVFQKSLAIILVGLFCVTAFSQSSKKAEILFYRGLHLEEVKGELKEAIAVYQQLLKEFADVRPIAAKALLHIGICYEKMGGREAQKAYERIISEFSDQREIAAEARVRLSLIEQPSSKAKEDKGFVVRQVWEGFGTAPLGTPSPDGQYISDVDWETGNLIVRDLVTGEKRLLTKDSSDWSQYAECSTFSPDSKQIAYAWLNEDWIYDLRIIGLDGSGPRIIYSSKEVEQILPVEWSPDGKHIWTVISQKDKIYKICEISVKDGSVRVLKSLGFHYPKKTSLSPDGHYLAYDLPQGKDSQRRDIFLLSTDSSQEIPLVEHAANDFVLGWMPDGSRILFSSDRTGTADAWAIQVVDGKPQGVPELVKKDIGNIYPLGFTQKGSYYYGIETMWSDVYVATLDVVRGKLISEPKPISERFVGSNFGPTWSPDGKFLAYVLGRKPYVLCIHSFENGEDRDLSLNLKYFNWPLWSPRGDAILLWGMDEMNQYGLFLVDHRTGDVTPVVKNENGKNVQQATWSPDGKAIFFRRFDSKENQFMMRDLETGKEKELLYDSSFRDSAVCDSAVSLEGKLLVFLSLPGSVLKIMPLEGGEIRELLRFEMPEYIPGYSGLAWTPDGKYVLFLKESISDGHGFPKTELWRVDIENGGTQPLGLAMVRMRNLSLNSDGRRIAFDSGQWKAEIWVMENFLQEIK